MSDDTKNTAKRGAQVEREERLNAALRANLRKRKDQARNKARKSAPKPSDDRLDADKNTSDKG